VDYLDFQAYVGITKHNGGLRATRELLSLCHIDEAKEVLNVGCGIGVTSAYIARRYGCRVVNVDIDERMIEWARRRAREAKVEDRVEFRVADVLDLPFEPDRFDVVFSESVLIFVDDKPAAIAECVRVTRPGGHVGLSESCWLADRMRDVVAQMHVLGLDADVPTAAEWRALWASSGLEDRVVRLRHVDTRREIRDRIEWVGPRWALRGFGRGLLLYLRDPTARGMLREYFTAPSIQLMSKLGYGIFAGRKENLGIAPTIG